MLPFDRARAVAAVVGILVAGVALDASARDATRDFPKFAKCPVHSDALLPGGDALNSLVFQASTPTADLTFLSCDDRAFAFESINLSIDDLVVIEKNLFNANRLAYPGEVPDSYKIAKTTIGDSAPVCYQGNPVATVLDRSVLHRARKSFVPLFEDFEADCRDWTLINASIGKDPKDGDGFNPPTSSRALILARSERNADRGTSCSSASIKLRNLVKGREYVIDFSWFATGFEDADGSDTGQNVLTVSLLDAKGKELLGDSQP
jgi:hypothetical protein